MFSGLDVTSRNPVERLEAVEARIQERVRAGLELMGTARPSGSLPELIYQMLEGSGLATVILGPLEPSFMVAQPRAGVDYFAQSVALLNGLTERPGTESLWAIVDGPQIEGVRWSV